MIDLDETQLDDEETAAFVECQREKAVREVDERKKLDQKIRQFPLVRWHVSRLQTIDYREECNKKSLRPRCLMALAPYRSHIDRAVKTVRPMVAHRIAAIRLATQAQGELLSALRWWGWP